MTTNTSSISISAEDKIYIEGDIFCEGDVIVDNYENNPSGLGITLGKIKNAIISSNVYTYVKINVSGNIYIKSNNINTIKNMLYDKSPSRLIYTYGIVEMNCDNLFIDSKNLDIMEINTNFIGSNLRSMKLDRILKKIK